MRRCIQVLSIELLVSFYAILVSSSGTDICKTSPRYCPANATSCFNTSLGLNCTCQKGYEWDNEVEKCRDIDECNNGSINSRCSENSTCVNYEGGFECRCDTGYTGNGTHCQDLNECSTSIPPCLERIATCLNTIGSFTCQCVDGFAGDGRAFCYRRCDNDNMCHEKASCKEMRDLGRVCICKAGYTGFGDDCQVSPRVTKEDKCKLDGSGQACQGNSVPSPQEDKEDDSDLFIVLAVVAIPLLVISMMLFLVTFAFVRGL